MSKTGVDQFWCYSGVPLCRSITSLQNSEHFPLFPRLNGLFNFPEHNEFNNNTEVVIVSLLSTAENRSYYDHTRYEQRGYTLLSACMLKKITWK